MVGVPEWEYHYRWAEMAGSLAEMADELEARDQALEAHLRDGYGSSTCFIQFEYQYRWAQILAQPQDVQIALLEANMEALEQAVTDAGGCPLEFPYRWAQFLPGLAEGEDWAIACAEENDRAIEARFNECTCAPGFAFSFTTESSVVEVGDTNNPDFSLVTAVPSNMFLHVIYTNLVFDPGPTASLDLNNVVDLSNIHHIELTEGDADYIVPITWTPSGPSWRPEMVLGQANADFMSVRFYGDLDVTPDYDETAIWDTV